MPPTLLKKGSLLSNDANIELQKSLDKKVPLEHIMEWFKTNMNSNSIANRVLVLKSDTGSGKSTAFPARLFEVFFKKGGGGIACAQPRVLNAVSIVRDLVASNYYPSLKLGETIGWQTGPTKHATKYGLTYMTIGVLAMQLKTLTDDQLMLKYKFIIVDEVHESSLEQAMLLFSLRNFLRRNATNPNLPFVILTSATFEVNKFLKYFDVYSDDNAQPNLIQVTGFTYPLAEEWWLEKSTADYIATAADFVKKIHITNEKDTPDNADILIFLPGVAEITNLREKLDAVNKELYLKGKPVFLPLTILSETVSENKPEYIAVFAAYESLEVKIEKQRLKPSRRVILSTNVAETGVTIDTLKYVIDSGFNRTPEYNPNFRSQTLLTKAATKAMIRQRMGRANRKSPGVFVPLYPKYVWEKLDDIQLSSMETNDMSSIILSLLHEQVRVDKFQGHQGPLDISRIDMLDMPPLDSLADSIEKLYELGFISPLSDFEYTPLDNTNYLDRAEIIRDKTAEVPKYNLTKLGALAATSFGRIQPEIIRMILSSYAWDCSTLDLITIGAWLMLDVDINVSKDKQMDHLAVYRDGLPYYFVGGIDGSIHGDLIYKIKLLLSDDFIMGIVIYSAIGKILSNEPNKYIDLLRTWCDNRNINFKAIMSLITIRDELIDSMITGGLHVFTANKTLMNLPEETFLDGVMKIKLCIYDGFKSNLATYDPTLNVYITKHGIPIKTPEIFTINELRLAEDKKYQITSTTKPKYILYNQLDMKMDRKTQLYKAKVQHACMLDGFI